ncbi:uncharacterized protein LOC134159975 [Pezoporus occidentalis]|uniref:uncharacterized protein LOC134159975 n=1 Tax=Pezoporus occidentalis TaxID=407982 RepID=UPI002F91238B
MCIYGVELVPPPSHPRPASWKQDRVRYLRSPPARQPRLSHGSARRAVGTGGSGGIFCRAATEKLPGLSERTRESCGPRMLREELPGLPGPRSPKRGRGNRDSAGLDRRSGSEMLVVRVVPPPPHLPALSITKAASCLQEPVPLEPGREGSSPGPAEGARCRHGAASAARPPRRLPPLSIHPSLAAFLHHILLLLLIPSRSVPAIPLPHLRGGGPEGSPSSFPRDWEAEGGAATGEGESEGPVRFRPLLRQGEEGERGSGTPSTAPITPNALSLPWQSASLSPCAKREKDKVLLHSAAGKAKRAGKRDPEIRRAPSHFPGMMA